MATNSLGLEDPKQREIQYGILFPNGDQAFVHGQVPRSPLLSFLTFSVDLSTSEGRGKALDEYTRQFSYLGVLPEDTPRIEFVKRTRYVSYGESEQI